MLEEELDFDIGTGDMYCECSTNKYMYCYEPAGHVLTGDLVECYVLMASGRGKAGYVCV